MVIPQLQCSILKELRVVHPAMDFSHLKQIFPCRYLSRNCFLRIGSTCHSACDNDKITSRVHWRVNNSNSFVQLVLQHCWETSFLTIRTCGYTSFFFLAQVKVMQYLGEIHVSSTQWKLHVQPPSHTEHRKQKITKSEKKSGQIKKIALSVTKYRILASPVQRWVYGRFLMYAGDAIIIA